MMAADSRAARPDTGRRGGWSQGLDGRVDLAHWAITEVRPGFLTMPTWPEDDPHIRFILQPSWRCRKETRSILRQPQPSRLDLGLFQGRGRDRDGIWTTGRTHSLRKGKPDPDGVYRGRYARLRKRSTSEPPPNSFSVANFPAPNQQAAKTMLQIFFPRMTLATLDAKARRRSLSRTRIESMFDWDVSPAPRKNSSHEKGGRKVAERREPRAVKPAVPDSPSKAVVEAEALAFLARSRSPQPEPEPEPEPERGPKEGQAEAKEPSPSPLRELLRALPCNVRLPSSLRPLRRPESVYILVRRPYAAARDRPARPPAGPSAPPGFPPRQLRGR